MPDGGAFEKADMWRSCFLTATSTPNKSFSFGCSRCQHVDRLVYLEMSGILLSGMFLEKDCTRLKSLVVFATPSLEMLHAQDVWRPVGEDKIKSFVEYRQLYSDTCLVSSYVRSA